MKRTAIIIIVLLSCLVSHASFAGGAAKGAATDGIRAEKLTGLISEFSRKEGFDVVRIGRFGTSAIKSIIRLGALADGDSDEAKAFKDVIGGLRKLAIVDYGECSDSDRQRFERKLERLLRDEDLIMEVKDGGESYRIFGVLDEDSDKLRDFVLYDPSDCSLICLFGSMSLSALTSAVDR